MKLKEFFKPTKSKLYLTFIILLVLYFLPLIPCEYEIWITFGPIIESQSFFSLKDITFPHSNICKNINLVTIIPIYIITSYIISISAINLKNKIK